MCYLYCVGIDVEILMFHFILQAICGVYVVDWDDHCVSCARCAGVLGAFSMLVFVVYASVTQKNVGALCAGGSSKSGEKALFICIVNVLM